MSTPTPPQKPTIENINHKSNNPKYSKLHIKAEGSIIVTYSWSAVSHNICGHNFEAFEFATILLEKNLNAGNIWYLIPDEGKPADNVIEALKSKYSEDAYEDLKLKLITGKPEVLTCGTVILCDGQLPTKGIIHANKLVMILCNQEPKWHTIDNFTGNNLELWYDSRLGYKIPEMVELIKKHRPDMDIVLKDTYIKRLRADLYKPYQPKAPTVDSPKRFLVYATGNCRDIYLADTKYQSDTLKEIKDILHEYQSVGHSPQSHIELLMIGWNPNYSLQEKMYFSNNQEQKIFEDRKRAAIMASDLSEYFDVDVVIVPECDLPIDNILEEFDTYIYTPTEKNWDCSSRLIAECYHFGKGLVLTKTAESLVSSNLGLKYRIQDYFPALLRKEPK